MIKRFTAIVLLTAGIFLSLCGCMGYREIDGGYLLTAIGFEMADGGLRVTAEMLITADTQESSPEPQLLSAVGATPEQALYNLSLDFSKPVYFDHCAALIIGDGVEGEQLQSVIKYCKKTKSLNLAVYTVSSPDVSALLETQTSSAAAGYHIMRMLAQRAKESGIDYRCRFYEIEQSAKDNAHTFSLPVITGGQEIEFGGEQIYKDFKKTLTLDNTESIAYSLVVGRFKNGRVCIGEDYADIKSVKRKLSAKVKDGTLAVSVQSKIRGTDITENFCATLQNTAAALILRAGQNDIFGAENDALMRENFSSSDYNAVEIDYKVECKK